MSRKPNLLFLFADQWRGQAAGFSGDANAITPNMDELYNRSTVFSNAFSGCPVCSPFRASLMTGKYPLSHGVFVNDVCLTDDCVKFAEVLKAAGYMTGYIGKWHMHGHGRSSYIPKEDRMGFDYWKVLECTHDYNNSFYYFGDEKVKRRWDGYDAIAQSDDACKYILDNKDDGPFALFVSWGPPHEPYETAPAEFQSLFKAEDIELRPNVPDECADVARKELKGYYAHLAALDVCVGRLLNTLRIAGIEDETIVVLTSDHGDMLYSHGNQKKQQPWDESIRIPFIVRCPSLLGCEHRVVDSVLGATDIMPTLLSLCGVAVPDSVEGDDLSGALTGGAVNDNEGVLLSCPWPFAQWWRDVGGKEYRGVRTSRYTYARDLQGPWILYDNEKDPYQLENLCGRASVAKLQRQLDTLLARKLRETCDEFLPGTEYLRKWGYEVNQRGAVPYIL